MKRILVAAIVIGIALIVIRGWDYVSLFTGLGLPTRTSPPMLIIAHRGNMTEWPEDTAEAIWDAARAGADGIEFDVHQSADGTWWVMHDAEVDRTTDGSGAIRDLTDAAMAQLVVDVGPRPDGASATIHPPTLTEVLDGLRGFEGELYIDLQHRTKGDASTLVNLLDDFNAAVICRNEDDVRAIHEAGGHVRTIIRPVRTDASTVADMYLLESVGETNVGRVLEYDRPVVTFTDERFEFLPEAAVLNRAWAANVRAFLSKHLRDALAIRDDLADD